MKNKLPISVCVISGAEAHRIGKCLASVADWTEEIIVVINPEVSDGTADIAAKFGARVFRHPFADFRDQKNLSSSYATQPWILSLDADEVVSPELHDAVTAFFANQPERFAGAQFPRKTWFMGRWITHGDWYPDRVLRLFQKEKGKWGGGSPEHCSVELTGPCATINADLLHYSNPTISSYVQKMNYFADAHLQRQLADGARWSAASAVSRSAWRFLRAYFLRRGFLDGYPGFFIAASTAYSTLVRHSRLFEHLRQTESSTCDPAKSR
jgi:glycosyltransferase involved in cell wall biosynthesis